MANSYWQTAKLKVQRRSGFNKDHYRAFTSKVGTLTPLLCDEVIPNSKVNLRINLSATLPPLASETYMKCDYKVEAFFVPMRLLYGGFENWLTKQDVYGYDEGSGSAGALGSYSAYRMPSVALGDERVTGSVGDNVAFGTLLDYLGYQRKAISDNELINGMPLFAYHRIWHDWYRNARVTRPIFYPYGNGGRTVDGETSATSSPFDWDVEGSIGWLPYLTFPDVDGQRPDSIPVTASFIDGRRLCDLRQRNFGADLYTTAMTSPQYGDAQSVSVSNNRFTISALRQANALQQFEERNGIASPRLQDYVKVNYGADLSSGVAQRTILLGSCQFDAYTHGINQTGYGTQSAAQPSVNNPFKSVGTEYGRMRTSGSDIIIRGFTAAEPGYIMVIGSLVPRVTYGCGIDPMFLRYLSDGSQTDMANPILQCVGNEPIFASQLSLSGSRTDVFGYVERYANWKTKQDSVHGLFRQSGFAGATGSLASFVAQRVIDTSPRINTAFLEIPTNYLDNVSAVGSEVSDYGVMAECMFDYKVSMPLSVYTIPSLENPAVEHGDTITVKRDGSHI